LKLLTPGGQIGDMTVKQNISLQVQTMFIYTLEI